MKKAYGLIFLVLLLLGLLWLGTREHTDKMVLIGVLHHTDNNLTTLKGFKAGMREKGYIEGENVQYMIRVVPEMKALKTAMGQLMEAECNLIFVSPTPAAIVAKMMTASNPIPVVFAPVNDPVDAGVVRNVITPEGNLTGIRLERSDGRRLQTLLFMVPSIKRVLIPYSPSSVSALTSLDMFREAVRGTGVILVPKKFYSETDILKDPSYIPQNVDAILLPRDSLVMSRIHAFVGASLDRRLPLSTPRFSQVERGAFMGYGFNGVEMGKQAARMASMILKGRPVSSLPIETAEDGLFINMRTAKAIGLHLDDAVMRQASMLVY